MTLFGKSTFLESFFCRSQRSLFYEQRRSSSRVKPVSEERFLFIKRAFDSRCPREAGRHLQEKRSRQWFSDEVKKKEEEENEKH
jgi:hypothetical protein